MKSIYISEVTEDNIWDILDQLNSDTELEIHNNSQWWNVNLFNIVRTTLDNLLKKEDIKITMYWYTMASAWFDLFYYFKGERILAEDAEAFLHKAAMQFPVFKDGNGDLRIRCTEWISNKRVKSMTQRDYNFLTEEELKRFEDWLDVHLNRNRLEEIIK